MTSPHIEPPVLPVAVYPPRGQVVHLFLDGYRPGAKSRSLSQASMCGAYVGHTTPPPVGPKPTGRVHVPLDEAVGIEAFDQPKPFDPRPQWRWCAVCLGRAAEHYGLIDKLLGHLLEIRPTASRA